MKKSVIAFILVIIIFVGSWVFLPSELMANIDLLESATVLILIVGIGFWVVLRYFQSKKNGEQAEDELSKLTLQKSSSLSYYISLYLWLLLSYFNSKLNLETEQLIGYGIIGMAFIFVGSWLFFSIKGINKNF